MIKKLKSIQPAIDFGNGNTTMQISTGETVTVWLSTLYNQEAYSFNLQADGLQAIRISDYEYRVTPALPGSYTLQMAIISIDKTISLTSNTLTLTVV
jgi:hypothetical protein